MRVAYYSPLPPSRSGIADYSSLLLPALRERVDVVLAQPGKRAPQRRRRPLSRRQRPRRSRVDRRCASQGARCRGVARVRAAPSRCRHHDRPWRCPRLPRCHGARARRRRTPARSRRARQSAAAALGDAAGALPAVGWHPRQRSRADRALAVRRRACALRGLRRPALAHPASGVARASRSGPPSTCPAIR